MLKMKKQVLTSEARVVTPLQQRRSPGEALSPRRHGSTYLRTEHDEEEPALVTHLPVLIFSIVVTCCLTYCKTYISYLNITL